MKITKQKQVIITFPDMKSEVTIRLRIQELSFQSLSIEKFCKYFSVLYKKKKTTNKPNKETDKIPRLPRLKP